MRDVRILVTGASGFIGTNLIEELITRNASLLNLDINPPLYSKHSPFWKDVDILDYKALIDAFQQFNPKYVIHLAARTDCDENTTVEEGYRANTEGTANVINAIKSTPSISRVVITSTQYVCRPGPLPTDDQFYDPHTVYGRSKVITEKITRRADLSCTWTIIRPTNVWGPWHLRYRRQFFAILRRGLYLHPGRKKCVKSYAYVGNVVHQIVKILEVPTQNVNRRTLYVGDLPLNTHNWVNGFSRALTGRDVRIVPRFLFRGLALCGDIVSFVSRRQFLITSSRFRNMTEDYIIPMDKTLKILGTNPYSLEDGFRETIAWLKKYDELQNREKRLYGRIRRRSGTSD